VIAGREVFLKSWRSFRQREFFGNGRDGWVRSCPQSPQKFLPRGIFSVAVGAFQLHLCPTLLTEFYSIAILGLTLRAYMVHILRGLEGGAKNCQHVEIWLTRMSVIFSFGSTCLSSGLQ